MLDSLPLTNDTSLVYLNCSYNAITKLDVRRCLKLRQLDFTSNKISEINLDSQKVLSILHCGNNLLKELKISNCIELVSLRCSNNSLSELNLTGINYVSHLQAENNELTFSTIKYNKIPNEL
jgi:Leucine-rich repeat (LRR) protein